MKRKGRIVDFTLLVTGIIALCTFAVHSINLGGPPYIVAHPIQTYKAILISPEIGHSRIAVLHDAVMTKGGALADIVYRRSLSLYYDRYTLRVPDHFIQAERDALIDADPASHMKHFVEDIQSTTDLSEDVRFDLDLYPKAKITLD